MHRATPQDFRAANIARQDWILDVMGNVDDSPRGEDFLPAAHAYLRELDFTPWALGASDEEEEEEEDEEDAEDDELSEEF